MGVLYTAVDPETADRLIVKVVRAPRATLASSLRREIRALRQLRHPGVVRIVADGASTAGPWYAMAHVDGVPLSTCVPRLGASALPLADLLTLVARLCQALAYVHDQGIVHGDLKPSNVIVCDGLRPVLIDFGLAAVVRLPSGEAALDELGWLGGTAEYLAPERVAGAPIDARSDLYALGVTLFELLTGEPPFVAPTPSAILRHHLSSAPPRLRDRCPHLSPSLEALVARLLAKAPADRIGHAEEVLEVLGELGARIDPTSERAVGASLYRPRLLGREELVGRLLATVERAAGGEGSLVLLSGDSGIGKTHLLNEIARRSAGRVVAAGGCRPIGDGDRRGPVAPLQPLRPFLQAVADRCVEQGDSARLHLLGEEPSPLAAYEPALAAAAPGRAGIGPPVSTRARVFASLRRALAGFAAETPLLVVLDDLQWADELTLAFLADLPAWLTRQPIAVIAAHRPGETRVPAALYAAPGITNLDLGGLDAGALHGVVADLLGVATPPPALGAFLARQADGNPFFVAEFLRAGLAQGSLRRAGATLRAADGAELTADHLRGLALPATVHGIVARRLDCLSDAARHLLEIAAAIGGDSDPAVIQVVADCGEDAAMDGLAELVRQQVLDALPSGDLRFPHDSLAEIAYRGIAAERRPPLHARVALALHDSLAGRVDADATLAHHWRRAERPDRELQHLPAAARRAYAASAFAEAATLWQRALTLAADGAAGAPDRRIRAEWEHGAAQAEFGLGQVDACEAHARRALAQLDRALPTDGNGWARIAAREAARFAARRVSRRRVRTVPDAGAQAAAGAAELLTHRFYYVDDSNALLATSLLAVNLAEQHGLEDEVPRAYIALAFLAGLLRLRRVAGRALARAQRGADAKRDANGRAYGLASEAVYLATFGRFAAAVAPAHAAERMLDEGIEAFVREIVVVTGAHIAYYRGRVGEAVAGYGEVERLARARDHLQTISWGLASRARCLHALGDFAAALPLIEETRAILARRPERQSAVFLDGLLASTLLHLGDVDGALAMADHTLVGLRQAPSMGFTSDEGYALALRVYLRLLADGAGDRGLHARARELLRRLRRFAWLLPAARPFALLRAAEYAEWRGRRRRAARLARRARATAAGFDMSRHAALADLVLARTAAATADRDRYAARASRYWHGEGRAAPDPQAARLRW